jgi:transposase
MISITDKYIEQLTTLNKSLVGENTQLKAENRWLKEQFLLAKDRRFGPSSEQTTPGQDQFVFNEAEAVAALAATEPEFQEISYKRRKAVGHREAAFANLEVEEHTYQLPEDERVCPQCNSQLEEMGVETRQELKFVPAQASVVKHNCVKYACRHCQREETTTPILTAPMPKPAFPNSMASPSAVAHIMTEKFVMASPLYRQEQQLARCGVDLSRQTLANWMIAGAEWLSIIFDRLHDLLVKMRYLHADETELQVLREPGRSASTKSRMWIYRSGRCQFIHSVDEHGQESAQIKLGPIILFDYQQTRGAEHPKNFLRDFAGFLHVDAYEAYDVYAAYAAAVILAACWAHARRKFDEAIKVLPAPERKNPDSTSPAKAGLEYCNRLYRIEAPIKDKTSGERLAVRLQKSKPVLDEFKLWLDDQAERTLPKTTLGGAVRYAIKQWKKLNTILLDGNVDIDNNRAERSIRPYVTGRKNWMFANTPAGAKSSAIIYSIIETAKENNLDPRKYLIHLFERLPNIDCKDLQQVDQLLPWAPTVQETCRLPDRK